MTGIEAALAKEGAQPRLGEDQCGTCGSTSTEWIAACDGCGGDRCKDCTVLIKQPVKDTPHSVVIEILCTECAAA